MDGGGPGRRRTDANDSVDSHFPQDQEGPSDWSPGFIDYSFLAFNQHTAFGSTDTSPLSKQAKNLSMLQALFLLLIIAIVAARVTAHAIEFRSSLS